MRHTLPDPSSGPEAWLALFSRSPSKVCNNFDLCTFVNSMLDNVAHDMLTGIAQFSCEMCPPPRP
eukprot:843040-Heterocapsa_arctica.AAC.1